MIQKDLLAALISEGHARALLMVSDTKRQMALRNQILEEGLSVRQAEVLVRPGRDGGSAAGKPGRTSRQGREFDPSVQDVEEKLRQRLGTRVVIQARSAKKGKIAIPYNSLEDFERILEIVGISLED